MPRSYLQHNAQANELAELPSFSPPMRPALSPVRLFVVVGGNYLTSGVNC